MAGHLWSKAERQHGALNAKCCKLIPKLAYQTNVSTFGGCVTRGVFYTGATFPSQYARNLFFCDYNSGKVMRCVMDASGNNISNTSVFVSGNSSLTDSPSFAQRNSLVPSSWRRITPSAMFSPNLFAAGSSMGAGPRDSRPSISGR